MRWRLGTGHGLLMLDAGAEARWGGRSSSSSRQRDMGLYHHQQQGGRDAEALVARTAADVCVYVCVCWGPYAAAA